MEPTNESDLFHWTGTVKGAVSAYFYLIYTLSHIRPFYCSLELRTRVAHSSSISIFRIISLSKLLRYAIPKNTLIGQHRRLGDLIVCSLNTLDHIHHKNIPPWHK